MLLIVHKESRRSKFHFADYAKSLMVHIFMTLYGSQRKLQLVAKFKNMFLVVFICGGIELKVL